jgi:predicted metal-binding membrane protein
MMSEITLNSADRDRSFLIVIGMILAAWAILVVWGHSPYSSQLDHHAIDPHAVQQGGLHLSAQLGLFLCGWFLMVLAMMLPINFLIKNPTHPPNLKQSGLKRLSPAYLSGYLAVWMAFGGMIYLGDAALHVGMERFGILDALSPAVFPALLLIVGVYQFSSTKRTCLYMDHVPNPAITETNYKYGQYISALKMGFQEGIYCLGSCWGLMLLMFASGSMNPLAMLGLTGMMVAEVLTPARWQFSRLLGFCLIVLAGVKVLNILNIV